MTALTQCCIRIFVLASVVVACAPDKQPARSTQEGLALLQRMQDALGGKQKIAAVRDMDETIRAEAWDARGGALGEVRKRTRWIQNPSTLRLDQIGPRGTYVLYFDGTSGSGWEILPDLKSPDVYRTIGKPVALTGGELEFARRYLSGFELNLWLADSRGYRVTSPQRNILSIQHNGTTTVLTLDPATSLPIKSTGISLADPDQPVPAEMRYEAWKEVSGVRFPTRRINYLRGMRRGEVTTSVITVNVGLRPQDLAAKPVVFTPEIALR